VEEGRTRWSELLKEFVETGTDKHISRQKPSKCLKELSEEKLIRKTVDPKALAYFHLFRSVYVVPKRSGEKLDYEAEKTSRFC